MPLDRLAVAGDPQLRQVLLYARRQREAFTAAEAAASLNVHRTVARSRLDRLVEAGFLTVTLERRGGKRGPGAGRPAKVYRVAPELEGIEFPNRRYADLIGLLLQKIPARTRERALHEAGLEFGRSLAEAAHVKPTRDVRAGLERVCDGLGALGFPVSLHSIEDGHAILETPTCPLRPLVATLPAAGEIDSGMWAGLVERGVRGVTDANVERDVPSCLSEHGTCRISVALARHEVLREPGSR